MSPSTVCYYCQDYLNADGYRLINEGRLQLLPANCRCDYCDRRENGKLWAIFGARAGSKTILSGERRSP